MTTGQEILYITGVALLVVIILALAICFHQFLWKNYRNQQQRLMDLEGRMDEQEARRKRPRNAYKDHPDRNPK